MRFLSSSPMILSRGLAVGSRDIPSSQVFYEVTEIAVEFGDLFVLGHRTDDTPKFRV